ncbi:MAG: tetratricopeptide repeat protein, partial [Phaeodactylibacter sp.]|nr:tetratricopeptide repeat protein [Phaeodactylibacter sp.]
RKILAKYEQMLEEGVAAFIPEDELIELIRYYEADDLPDRALELTDLGIEQFPFSSDFRLQKAHLLISLQEEEQALNLLDELQMLDPNEISIPLLQAEALSSMELFDDALLLLKNLQATASQDLLSDIYLTEALVHEQQEAYEQMFFALKAALLENPRNAEALKKMWFCVELSKKYKESIPFHLAIIDEHPYSDLAWYNLAHAYAYEGQYEEAIDAYEFAFVINPLFEFAYRDCAEICFEIQAYEKALNYYKEVLSKFEPDQDLLLQIGQCYFQLGRYAKAKAFYKQALRFDPDYDEVYYHLGECYVMEEQIDKAILAYNSAIQLENSREEYYAALGEAYYQVGKPEEALTCFEKATEIAPETTQYWIQYACFLLETGNFPLAYEVLEEAEMYAVGVEITYCQIATLFAMGRRQEALATLSTALDEDYFMHSSLFTLMPELEADLEIQAVIAAFQPY